VKSSQAADINPFPQPGTVHTPGVIHILDLRDQVKDVTYAKDYLSDHIIGMLLFAKHLNIIDDWEGALFQVPFVYENKNWKLRSNIEHICHPVLDPDNLVLTINGYNLCGSNNNLQQSPLTINTISSHPQYNIWVKNVPYAGGNKDSTTYTRLRAHNTKEACDAYVNELDYTPGPKPN
jgi:hypothetical protein